MDIDEEMRKFTEGFAYQPSKDVNKKKCDYCLETFNSNDYSQVIQPLFKYEGSSPIKVGELIAIKCKKCQRKRKKP